MTIPVFDLATLPPRAFHLRPALTGAQGGRPVSGPPQQGDLGAGFPWELEFQPRVLHSDAHYQAWWGSLAALLAISPVIDMRLPFSNAVEATLDGGHDLNDTEMAITTTAGAPKAGMLLSLRGASGYARLHLIAAVVDEAGNDWTLTVVPDLRENYSSGATVEFIAPVLSMTPDLASLGRAFAPVDQMPFRSSPAALFFEYWPYE